MKDEEYKEEVLSEVEMKNALKGEDKLFYECCLDRYIVEYTEASKKGARRIHEFYYARGNRKHKAIKNYHLEIKPNTEDVKVKYVKKI